MKVSKNIAVTMYHMSTVAKSGVDTYRNKMVFCEQRSLGISIGCRSIVIVQFVNNDVKCEC